MKYPYSVYQAKVEDHIFWIAKIPSLPGCVGQGDTLEEALSELSTNEKEWLDTAILCGIDIPEIPIVEESLPSGKFTVRVAPSVHQAAADRAKEQGISLNQYVNDAIVAYNTGHEMKSLFTDLIKSTIEDYIHLNKTVSSGSNTQFVTRINPFLVSNYS